VLTVDEINGRDLGCTRCKGKFRITLPLHATDFGKLAKVRDQPIQLFAHCVAPGFRRFLARK
jgi:hypothetical protein